MAQNKKVYFFNKTSGKMLAATADVAETFISRLVGLLNTACLSPGQGLYIAPCSQIHMIGMKYAIDAVFMDRQGMVVGLCKEIKPGQISALYPKAYACLELPAGMIENTQTNPGDQIESGEAKS